MSNKSSNDNFKAVLVGIFVIGSLIGLFISSQTNKSIYTIKNLEKPDSIIEVNELGNGMMDSLVKSLSNGGKIELSESILAQSSKSIKKLYKKTIAVMDAFPESKNPLQLEGYFSNVVDAITDSAIVNNIKSVNSGSLDSDIAVVKFIIALKAETTTTTIDNIQVSKDDNPKESAMRIFYQDMLLPSRANIRRLVVSSINTKIKNGISDEITSIIFKNLIKRHYEDDSSIKRIVLSSFYPSNPKS